MMIELFDISFDKVDVIKNLWEKNRQYHEDNSEYFSDTYHTICFYDRMKALKELDKGTLKTTVAREADEYIGYCISTAVDGKGEIESLHVSESRRGIGIGKELVIAHLAWMKESNCHLIGVNVSQENESTIKFYKKLGFYPNTLYMQLL